MKMFHPGIPAKSKNGLTVIEVLTSIVVAMIGVMGVMILVPFAVRQTQTGLDMEAAGVVARNAFSQLEVGGYRNWGNWMVVLDPATNPTGPAAPYSMVTSAPWPVSIDPLGITEQLDVNGLPQPNYLTTLFPFNHTGTFPGAYQIQVANLRLPSPDSHPIPMARLDARRLLQTNDDLVFEEPVQTLNQSNAPRQGFDHHLVGGVPQPARRQHAGSLSWSAIAVPNGQPVSNWKLYMLVYRDRPTDLSSFSLIPPNVATSNYMHTALVDQPQALASPISTITIDHVQFGNGKLKKDDWVMLVNQIASPILDVDGNVTSYHPPQSNMPGDFWQIGFYRVVNFHFLNGQTLVTLNGPDYDFRQIVGTDPVTSVDLRAHYPTYIVHLQNVVGVYERTIQPEGQSNWNISF